MDLYPKLFIGSVVPDGWDREYPTLVLRSINDVRDFVGNYGQMSVDFKVGIDLRDLDQRSFSALLKVLEDSNLKIILRVNEPVSDTILSRAAEVRKKERVEERSLTEALVGSYSIVASKIVGLSNA